jgi:hypothetical protein
MLIFTIIMFGLACVRELHKLTEPNKFNLGRVLVALSLIWSYIWFLSQFVKVK